MKAQNFVVISLGSGYYDLCETGTDHTLEQVKKEIIEYNSFALTPKWVSGTFTTREEAVTAINILQRMNQNG